MNHCYFGTTNAAICGRPAGQRSFPIADGIRAILNGCSDGFGHMAGDCLLIDFTEDVCAFRPGLDRGVPGPSDTLFFALDNQSCSNSFGVVPPVDTSWYLSADVRGQYRAVVKTEGNDARSDLLRAARSIELLNTTFAALAEQRLVPANGPQLLRDQDIRSIVAAHRIVTEDWHRPLTVQGIARQCGISRTKLASGFRQLYRCSVGEAVTERRMEGARRLLTDSNLHISTVGYRCGYTNNASFSRAFARRFGMTASAMRKGSRSQASPV